MKPISFILFAFSMALASCATNSGGSSSVKSKSGTLASTHNNWISLLTENGNCHVSTWSVGQTEVDISFFLSGSDKFFYIQYPDAIKRRFEVGAPTLRIQNGEEFSMKRSKDGRYYFIDGEAKLKRVFDAFSSSEVAYIDASSFSKAFVSENYGNPFVYDRTPKPGSTGVPTVQIYPTKNQQSHFRVGAFAEAVNSCRGYGQKRLYSKKETANFLYHTARGTEELGRLGRSKTGTYEDVVRAQASLFPRDNSGGSFKLFDTSALTGKSARKVAAGIAVGAFVWVAMGDENRQKIKRHYAASRGETPSGSTTSSTQQSRPSTNASSANRNHRIERYGTSPDGSETAFRITCGNGIKHRYWPQGNEWAGPAGAAGFRYLTIEEIAEKRCG